MPPKSTDEANKAKKSSFAPVFMAVLSVLFCAGAFIRPPNTNQVPCPQPSQDTPEPVECPSIPPATPSPPAPPRPALSVNAQDSMPPLVNPPDLDGMLTPEEEKKMLDACPANRRLRADPSKSTDTFIKETFRVLNQIVLKDVWDNDDPRPILMLARQNDKIFEKHPSIMTGFWAEFGVYTGGSLKMFEHYLRLKNKFTGVIAGFDSFQGLPVKWRSAFGAGSFSQGTDSKGMTLYDRVRAFLPDSVELYKGWFQDTIGTFKAKYPRKPATLIHHDGDLFLSTTITFQMLADRIVPGTHMIFDELQGYPGYKGHEILALYLWMVEQDAEICAMGIREEIKEDWFEEARERHAFSQSAWFQVLSTKASRRWRRSS